VGGVKAWRVQIWDAATGRLEHELPDNEDHDGSAAIAFSPDGQWLVTGEPTQYRFWRVGTWTPGLTITRQGPPVHGALAFSRDGRILAICWSYRNVRLMEALTGQEIATLNAPDPISMTWLCFSPDGSQLAAATGTNSVQLWDLRLVRQQLAEMGLDWSSPPSFARPEAGRPPVPLSVEVIPGDCREPGR
jgi:hypothetical protein